MKRLLLGLAVTLGLCTGLGASAQATPPPAAPVMAAPVVSAHSLVVLPTVATTSTSTVTVGSITLGSALAPSSQPAVDARVGRCKIPGVSTVCKRVASYLSSKWPVVKSWAQKSWTYFKAQMLGLWKQVPAVVRGAVQYFLIEFLLWLYELWH